MNSARARGVMHCTSTIGIRLGLLALLTLIVGLGALLAPFALLAFVFGFRYARKLYQQAEEMDDV